MIYSWGHNRRYHAYSNYFKSVFGERIQKLSVDMGFTCPNRDGTLAYGGCTYCNNDAFNPSYCHPSKTLTQQIEEGIEFHKKRYRKAGKYLVYFQTYSNTYAPVEHLKNIYNEALSHKQVVGLVIGTRPDCIDREKLDFFAEINKRYYLTIEYGIESCNDTTLEMINRQHTFKQSVEAIRLTNQYNIKTGAHFIIGLPGEKKTDILKQLTQINQLPLNSIKFHQLQIVKGTTLAKQYAQDPENFNLFELNEYIELIVKVVERLNPAFVIERFAGEVPTRYKIEPDWGLIRNDQINQMIEKRLEEADTFQGKFFH